MGPHRGNPWGLASHCRLVDGFRNPRESEELRPPFALRGPMFPRRGSLRGRGGNDLRGHRLYLGPLARRLCLRLPRRGTPRVARPRMAVPRCGGGPLEQTGQGLPDGGRLLDPHRHLLARRATARRPSKQRIRSFFRARTRPKPNRFARATSVRSPRSTKCATAQFCTAILR